MESKTVILRKKEKRYSIQDLKVGDITLSVTYLNPEQSTKGHQHEYEELYYIGYGVGRIVIGNEEKKISMGQFYLIPPDTFHQVKNDGLMTLAIICVWREK